MKSYDLKPTFNNLLKTYLEDTIGRNGDLFKFIEILDSIEDGCTIALDGNWGSGKTFFVNQVKMILDAHNTSINHDNDADTDKIISTRINYYQDRSFDLQPQVCVYYDAWLNDNDEDPVMSLLYTIMQSVDSEFSFTDFSFIKSGASIMELFTGRNWRQVIDSLKSYSPVDSIKENRDITSLVDEFFNSLLAEKGNRLIIIIDELDRCKPSYAVRLLERIKHYFSNDNITFVLSVNTNELQHTIRKFYGNEFDGFRYLDRFFDLRVTLSPPDLQKYYDSLNFNDRKYTYDIVCGKVIEVYRFDLREIAKYLRLTKMAAYSPTHEGDYDFIFSEGKAMQFCLYFIAPIILGLKMHDLKKYTEFIQGKDYTPLIEIASELPITIFGDLLEKDETYNNQNVKQVVVTIEDKLKMVYDSLFITKDDSIKIGEYRFSTITKDELMRACDLLSEYTLLDVEEEN